ncbi:MAG: zinc ribbon domain-containing protein [Acidobacteria bacterium]|nr:zinc ribbon domain-containing protein [Acidobacteriota bacterium]
MKCPKCSQENLETTRFCNRCHTPLHYYCPACKHVQTHSGTCDQCGVDFAKYAAMLVFKAQADSGLAKERARTRMGVVKQIVLLPITGGFSLVKYLLEYLRGQ